MPRGRPGRGRAAAGGRRLSGPAGSEGPGGLTEPSDPAETQSAGTQDRPGAGLPSEVRDVVLGLAAQRLGTLPPEQVPPSLRAFARFTPTKRARLAAVPLAAALETDPTFRAAVAEHVRRALPDVAAAVERGVGLPAAPVQDVAAVAYLLRPQDWRDRLAEAEESLRLRGQQRAGEQDQEALRQLGEQLQAVRLAARVDAEALRAEAAAARAELAVVRRKVRELGDRAGRAEAAQRQAEAALAVEREQQDRDREQAAAATSRLAERLAGAEEALRAGRQAVREGRQHNELRLRVLLDSLLGAAQGLRRELALAPAAGRPADALAEDYPAPSGTAGAQGRSADDPLLLDALVTVPMTHLLVDGYNVTKLGYGEVTLEAQRGRLIAGLGALAARSGAEVTVVFDGTERVGPVAAAAPRGVRLLFSRDGESADEVLRRLVRHEPAGRPVLVVSDDREVADGIRASGGRPVPSRALLRLLSRP